MGEDSGIKSSSCICLVSRDGEHVEVPLHIAKLSNLVTNAIEDDDDDDTSDSDSDNEESNTPQIVMIPNVTSDILQKVIEFCTYHETKEQMTPISTPLQSCKLEDLVQDWYVQFCHDVTPSSSNEGGHESGGDMTRDDNDEDKMNTASSTTTTTTTTNQLFELVAAANYMDIKPLLDLTCLAVSVWIKGKSAEEITQMFHLNLNIGDDGGKGTSASSISKEEEDETKWCDKPTVH